MSDNANQASPPQPLTREERLAQMAQHTAELQKKHPEQDLKTGEEWWAPGIHFSFDCQETLDEDTNKRFNACIAKIFAAKYAPDVVNAALDEARECLAGHDELQKQFDIVYGNRDGWGALHKHVMEQGDEFKSPTGEGVA